MSSDGLLAGVFFAGVFIDDVFFLADIVLVDVL